MGTLAIQASGFSALPAQAPAGWPAGIAWPAGGLPNGTKSMTISDADWINLLTWTAASQLTAPASPTAPQILLAWVQVWITGTVNAVQQYFTQPATQPPPITVT